MGGGCCAPPCRLVLLLSPPDLEPGCVGEDSRIDHGSTRGACGVEGCRRHSQRGQAADTADSTLGHPANRVRGAGLARAPGRLHGDEGNSFRADRRRCVRRRQVIAVGRRRHRTRAWSRRRDLGRWRAIRRLRLGSCPRVVRRSGGPRVVRRSGGPVLSGRSGGPVLSGGVAVPVLSGGVAVPVLSGGVAVPCCPAEWRSPCCRRSGGPLLSGSGQWCPAKWIGRPGGVGWPSGRCHPRPAGGGSSALAVPTNADAQTKTPTRARVPIRTRGARRRRLRGSRLLRTTTHLPSTPLSPHDGLFLPDGSIAPHARDHHCKRRAPKGGRSSWRRARRGRARLKSG